ncbi:MAG: hypothetical protein ACO3K7_06440 [Candidatus Marinamargulisbacteria bacterium]
MKLTDHSPEDQLCYIQSFIENCQNISEKFNENKKHPLMNQFLLSQMIDKF